MYYLVISLLLHLGISMIKIDSPPPPPKPTNEAYRLDVKIEKKKGIKEEMYIINDLIKQLNKEIKEEGFAREITKPCLTHYRGIGISHSGYMGTITKVAPGGPADRAGIKVGDISVSGLLIRNKYPIGTIITVSIIRDGIIMDIPVTIGKICTTPEP